MLRKTRNSLSSICATARHKSIKVFLALDRLCRAVCGQEGNCQKCNVREEHRRYAHHTFVFYLSLSLLWVDCGFAQLAYPAREDSELMATVLTRLAQRADPLANIYLNKQRAEGMSSDHGSADEHG